MSSVLSLCSLRAIAAEAGACACGAAPAGPIGHDDVRQFDRWIAEGRHAAMTYMERYPDLRADPRLLLDGAQTVIVCAFSYFTSEPVNLPIALYARGRDYHEVVRERLQLISTRITALHGGLTRLCVDTAPLRERLWATRCGLGFIGLNNQLIVPSTGSYVFLGTILWTGRAESSQPLAGDCGHCRRCIAACPAKALQADGSALDARRCLSYLTIEHRGDFHPATDLCGHLYGCDECQRVCPHNSAAAPTPIADFHPSEALAHLTAPDVAAMTPQQFNALFRHSAIRRTKLTGLLRNLHHNP